MLMSDDERTAVAQVLLDVNGGQVTRALASEVMAAAQPARDAGIQVEAGGVLGVRLSEEKSRRSEMIGLGVGIVILAVTFGTLAAAGMPIVTAVVALVTGLGLIGLLGHVADIPVVAPTLATMLGLGVGIDYALFIVFRYRDELHRGANVGEAVARAMATSGSAVVFAGVTVIIALLSLLVARVPLLGAMGWASALAVLVAVLTAITFLPAVLALVGRRIDALRLPWRRRLENAPDGENIWARWAAAVTRHPWISLIASLLVMLPLAAPTLTLILGQEDIGAWPTSTTQRRAYDLVSAGLGPGANGRFLVATGFSPAAEPSAAYTQKKERAERLAGRLEMDAKRLKRQGKALERRAAAAKADRSALESRGAALTAERAALEAKAAPLLAQKNQLLARKQQLLAQKNELLAQKRRLAAEGAAAQAEAASLAAQIGAVQAQ
ncbi:MAG: MMPL family transporter, partial [Thermoleophilia bacterium]|nr:MMPL family transporter [Thermoleophilia bacterium]